MGRLKDRWAGDGGYREVLTLAFPLILATSSWSIQHFVDRMFLAWYSPESLAAALPGGMLNFSITSFFVGTAGYVSTFVAQYHGAQKHHRIGPVVWQGIWLSLFGGLLLLAGIPFAVPLFNLAGHEPAVREMEIQYFQILCLGGFPVVSSAAIAGFFTGLGRTWPVLWLNVFNTGLNLCLDYLMIFGHWGFPEMGIRGAAWATVIAGTATMFLYFALFVIGGRNAEFHTLSGWRPNLRLFRRLLRFGAPAGVEFFSDMFTFSLFLLIVGRLGTESLAATNIALNINMLAFLPMIGNGMAVSILVGRYLGADQPRLAARSTWSGFHVTFIYMATVSATYVLFPGFFIGMFGGDSDPARFKDIYDLAVNCLWFAALFSLFDSMNVIFGSALKGAGDTRFLMVTLLSLAMGILVAPTFLAIEYLGGGLMTAWTMATLYITTLGLVFLSRFRGGKWRTMRVIETAAELRAVILENGDNDSPVSDSSPSMTQDVVCSGPMDPRDP